jgi:Tol biopolymer transport system component
MWRRAFYYTLALVVILVAVLSCGGGGGPDGAVYITEGRYPHWGPTGLLAYNDRLHTQIWVCDERGGQKRKILDTNYGEPAGVCDWSPDGDYLVISYGSRSSENQGLYILPASGGEMKFLVGDGYGAAWSPDGKQIAYTGADGYVYIIPAEGGVPRRVHEKIYQVYGIDWSPGGEWLIVDWHPYHQEGSETQWLVRPDGSGLHPSGLGDVSFVQWGPGGRFVAYSSYQHTETTEIFICDLKTKKEKQITAERESGRQYPFHPTWSPDGRRLAFSDNVNQIRVIDIK